MRDLRILAGLSNNKLATEICSHLEVSLCKVKINRFIDGEISVQIEENTRGTDLYIVQSLSTPVNDHLMELLLLIDAARRASAKSITCVIPYYGYARQDRKNKPRVPISAALVAELLESAGATQVITCDLHCGQIEGFFRIPTDDIRGKNVLADKFLRTVKDLTNVCVVSPDAGGMERAISFRKTLANLDQSFKLDIAMMNKHRERPNEIETMELVGSVDGADAIIFDDMIDTAGTLCQAARILKENGAKRVYACITHALLNDPATKRILESQIEILFVTNTVTIKEEKIQALGKKLVVCCMGSTISECIRRIHNNESVSNMFQ